MESEGINISSESDTSTQAKPLATVSRRRSSIFRPDEDYNGSTLEKDYPAEYRVKLEIERQEWERLFKLTLHDFRVVKKQSVNSHNFKSDEIVLNNHHYAFLEQGPSPAEYLKTVDDFLNNLQLFNSVQEIDFKAKQLDKKCILSKISYVENTLLERLYNRCENDE